MGWDWNFLGCLSCILSCLTLAGCMICSLSIDIQHGISIIMYACNLLVYSECKREYFRRQYSSLLLTLISSAVPLDFLHTVRTLVLIYGDQLFQVQYSIVVTVLGKLWALDSSDIMSSIVCLSIHHRVNNFKHSFSIPTSDDEVGALKTGFNGLGWVVIGILTANCSTAILWPFQRCFWS